MATATYCNRDADEKDEVSSGHVVVEWLHAINNTDAKAYLHFYNNVAANVVIGTTVPDLSIELQTTGDTNGTGCFGPLGPNGQVFSGGLTISCSTNADGSDGDPGGVVVNMGLN